MIFVTGDIHGDPFRFNKASFPEQEEMSKDDYLIICGDFGCVWNYKGESKEEKHNLKWLDSRNFTTLFCDGNHENFERLNAYPIEEWHGGLVHKIRPSVIHLMRGQMYDIDEKKVFVFGGASSHDIKDGILDPVKDKEKIKEWSSYTSNKLFRIRNVSWWEEELPSQKEMDTGIKTLDENAWKCDFVITHSPDSNILAQMSAGRGKPDYLSDYLFDSYCSQGYLVKQAFPPTKAVEYQQVDKIILLFIGMCYSSEEKN